MIALNVLDIRTGRPPGDPSLSLSPADDPVNWRAVPLQAHHLMCRIIKLGFAAGADITFTEGTTDDGVHYVGVEARWKSGGTDEAVMTPDAATHRWVYFVPATNLVPFTGATLMDLLAAFQRAHRLIPAAFGELADTVVNF